MRAAATILSALALSGCGKDPQSVEPTSNTSIAVELLFEKDGHKVHRFYDHGRPVYYVTPVGSVSHQESCGKGCARPVLTHSVGEGV